MKPLLGPILALYLVLHVAAASTTNSPYTSVASLDKYGNSVQLSHAREAVARHGTLVVAAAFRDGIVAASIYKPKLGIVDVKPVLIHALSLYTPPLGIVVSGLKADARWLVETLRDYQRRNWESYDLENLSIRQSQHALSHALLTFMGYDRDKELHDGLVVDPEQSWARPLGVSCMVVTVDSSILVIEPSGVTQKVYAYAIGQGAKEVNEKLERLYEPNLSLQEVKDMLVDITREFVKSVGVDAELLMEVLTRDRIQRIHP